MPSVVRRRLESAARRMTAVDGMTYGGPMHPRFRRPAPVSSASVGQTLSSKGTGSRGNATRHLWGLITRSPRAADAALAVGAFLTTLFLAFETVDDIAARPLRDVPFAALLLLALASGALYWRRSKPLTVLWTTIVASILASAIGSAELAGGVAMLVALYTVGRYVDDERWSYLGLAGGFAILGFDYVLGEMTAAAVGFGLVVLSVVWYVGRRIRMRAERAVQLQREHEAEAQRVVSEERTRIARELHDVVAHRVSLMTVQAGAAKTVAADDPKAALQAMEAVEHAGREALDELRHLLGVLRPQADGGSLGPQPSLADLPRLVDQLGDAGLDVSLTKTNVPTDLPARVDLSAYRIVQEALTNVLKHAGPSARADVRVSTKSGAVTIEVSDDGRGATSLAGSGHGIMGMRERAVLLGGSLTAGPRAEGGFRVAARLPITGGSA